MSSRIHSKQSTKLQSRSNPIDEGKIFISCKYLTDNKKYNFSHFKNDFRTAKEAYDDLFSKLKDLGKHTMRSIMQLDKRNGLESIPFSMFHQSFQQIMLRTEIVTKDSKLFVLRFHNQQYRMICMPNPLHQNIWYIIGFDFDYSAYSHN